MEPEGQRDALPATWTPSFLSGSAAPRVAALGDAPAAKARTLSRAPPTPSNQHKHRNRRPRPARHQQHERALTPRLAGQGPRSHTSGHAAGFIRNHRANKQRKGSLKGIWGRAQMNSPSLMHSFDPAPKGGAISYHANLFLKCTLTH